MTGRDIGREEQVLGRLFGSGRWRKDIATGIYGAIVAQARTPAIYAELGVPDTVAGRFEMVVLHIAAALERFEAGNDKERMIGEDVFQVFCTDMDETLREFGVSDVVMGKRMKKMAQSFYGRSRAYGKSVQAENASDLAAALGRNIYPDEERRADDALAEYAMRVWKQYRSIAAGQLENGAVAFPGVDAGLAR